MLNNRQKQTMYLEGQVAIIGQLVVAHCLEYLSPLVRMKLLVSFHLTKGIITVTECGGGGAVLIPDHSLHTHARAIKLLTLHN
jgi:hypothetical protein